jgi:hypothetical protein
MKLWAKLIGKQRVRCPSLGPTTEGTRERTRQAKNGRQHERVCTAMGWEKLSVMLLNGVEEPERGSPASMSGDKRGRGCPITTVIGSRW